MKSRSLAILLILLSAAFAFGQEEEEQARGYKTREERRSAGLKYKLTEQITLTGLFESEYVYESPDHEDEFSAPLQLGLEVVPASWAKVELVYEFDIAVNEHVLDEAVFIVEAGDFDVELGKLYVPFGEYFSHFVNGPLLEFGETRDAGIVLSYTPDERFDLSTFLYKGRAVSEEPDSSSVDFGFAVDFSPFEFGTFALSYISDLADSQVPALSGYALIGYGQFEVTGEFVHALSSFQELEGEQNKPRAWNFEVAYYPKNEVELAWRYERSKEFENGPRFKTGFGVTWHALKNMYVSLEYLYGRFAEFDESESSNLHQFGARISIL